MSDDRIADATITKVDEDKRLVFGWASIIKDAEGKVLLDRQDDYIDDEAELEKAAYSYVLNSRDGGEMHVRTGVSTMVESVVLSKEKQEALGIPAGTLPIGWWIGFRVDDDRVWDEVKKGGYVGFSVHGSGRREQNVLNPAEITEVEKRALSAAEEDALRRHGADYTGKHMRIMRRYMEQGLTLEAAHQRAEREVGKADCGCGCDGGNEGDEPVVKVGVRLVALMAKATKRKNDKIAQVLREYDAGTLKSHDGQPVRSRRQALAIAISERDRAAKGGDYHGHPFRGNQFSGAGGTGRMGGSGSRRPVGKHTPGGVSHDQMSHASGGRGAAYTARTQPKDANGKAVNLPSGVIKNDEGHYHTDHMNTGQFGGITHPPGGGAVYDSYHTMVGKKSVKVVSGVSWREETSSNTPDHAERVWNNRGAISEALMASGQFPVPGTLTYDRRTRKGGMVPDGIVKAGRIRVKFNDNGTMDITGQYKAVLATGVPAV